MWITFLNQDIVKKNISIYNEKTGKGLVRHFVTKIGIRTNEIMCIIVINGKEIPYEKELVNEIIKKFPNVKTIIKNINDTKSITKNTFGNFTFITDFATVKLIKEKVVLIYEKKK